ncbi:FAD-binding oxidoreductase [Domibacillus sp. A3M-37]|uniref:NAD(P)/FAD-dependent oxidoreductase n=1 Tax=Domibacillus sp. A3M-37 TaxID=2962037 RepID=UPI0020B6E62C|nr:FAD-dependent oxidoreductase [Domibacillus sp. A3M-37]MCP3761817.1 FAD-binding oxidoreductase [Domibacillus sp. A3M-37]
MDLKSGNLYWPDTLKEKPSYPIVEENMECDVVIIGAGVSGACTAYELKDSGLDIILIDKRTVAAGSSSANTGLLQFSNDQLLHEAIRAFGKTAAVDHYWRCFNAISRLRDEIVPSLSIDPELIMRESLFFASNEDEIETVQEEYKALKEAGFDVEYVEKDEMKKWVPFSRRAAIITKGDAEVNPYKLTHGLVKAASDAGVRIFEQTEVFLKKADEDGVLIRAAGGYLIKAKKAIFAQGYETQETVKEKNTVIESSYAIVTNSIDDLSFWKDNVMIWESARPYFYARTTADYRIVIGGLDERTSNPDMRDQKMIAKRDELIKEVESWFPQLQGAIQAEYNWSGSFAHTHDGQPMIGQYGRVPNSYFLLGYGGNGIVYSLFLSKLVARHIMGKKDPAFSFYSKERVYEPE